MNDGIWINDTWITVPQVARAMGVELDNRAAWAIGSQVASLYAERVGTQPPKDNRPKTNGGGSHCFALYPPAWESTIRSVIEGHQDAERSQGDLFEA